MTINWPIAILAIIYVLVETRYFGWNFVPKSDAEILADGIGYILFALAIAAGDKP